MSLSLTITTIGKLWMNLIKPTISLPDMGILFLNRNARVPKKANHGARPCSSVMRRERRK